MNIARGVLLTCLVLVLVPFVGIGQVIDEHTNHDTTYNRGGSGWYYDYGQTFVSDIRVLRITGAWLQQLDPTGRVQIAINQVDSNGDPVVDGEIYFSKIFDPGLLGQFEYDSSNFAFLVPGQEYYLMINLWPVFSLPGNSAVGLSNGTTDSGDDVLIADTASQTYYSVPNKRLSIHVEGDTCLSPPLQLTPYDSVRPDSIELCAGTPLTLDAGPGLFHLWSTGDSGRALDITTGGIYSVQVADSNGCYSTDTMQITFLARPTVSFGPDQDACDGEVVQLIGPAGQPKYEWSTGDSLFGLNVTSAGTYWCTVTGPTGCTSSDTITINFYPRPSVNLGNDTTLCDGDFVLYNAGSGFQKYTWSNGDADCCTSINDSGLVFVIVTDSNGCTAVSDTVIITLANSPPPPEITTSGSFLVSDPSAAYQWHLDGNPIPGGTSQNLVPPQSGSYEVTITDWNGCVATSNSFELLIEVDAAEIPEGFSPNGDGINDYFVIDGVDFFSDATLIIYNRWGTEVFRKRNYQSDWGGESSDGTQLPDGTYYYVLDLQDQEKPYQGVVVIHR